MKESPMDRSTSLHHTDKKHGLCVVLNYQGGDRWKLYSTPIPHGRGGDCCPKISSYDAVTIREKAILEAISYAKERGGKMLVLPAKGHDVELSVKNVEAKIKHVHTLEASYAFNKPKKRKRK